MFEVDVYSFNNIILEQISMVISVVFISSLIAISIYFLAKSWDEGKERALQRSDIERQEELKRKGFVLINC